MAAVKVFAVINRGIAVVEALRVDGLHGETGTQAVSRATEGHCGGDATSQILVTMDGCRSHASQSVSRASA